MSASRPRPAVDMWTDGACSGNPGPGGWGVLLQAGAHERELSGGEPDTTNNRMELTAVLRGLQALDRPCQVAVHLDSAYVMDAFAKNWLAGWQRRGWRTSANKPVANRDLWEQLLVEVARHSVRWVKVKGHAGVANNERVDRLAVAACRAHGGRQA